MQKLITNAEHTSSTTQKLEKTAKTSFPEANLVGKPTYYSESSIFNLVNSSRGLGLKKP